MHASKATESFDATLAEAFFTDYEKIFETESFCDLNLSMRDGKIIKANKAILATRSPIFFNLLSADTMRGDAANININDVDSETMTELLRFVYCNRVKGLAKVAYSLIVAAEKYQLSHLKELCCNHIITKLSEENVTRALIVSDATNTQKLFQKCIDFIVG